MSFGMSGVGLSGAALAPAGPRFPDQIAGCIAWLDHKSGVTLDANRRVSEWSDRLSGFAFGQEDEFMRPHKLPDGLVFGLDGVLAGPSSAAGSESFLESIHFLLSPAADPGFYLMNSGGQIQLLVMGTYQVIDSGLPFAGLEIVDVRLDGVSVMATTDINTEYLEAYGEIEVWMGGATAPDHAVEVVVRVMSSLDLIGRGDRTFIIVSDDTRYSPVDYFRFEGNAELKLSRRDNLSVWQDFNEYPIRGFMTSDARAFVFTGISSGWAASVSGYEVAETGSAHLLYREDLMPLAAADLFGVAIGASEDVGHVIRHLVVFDRALSSEEIAEVVTALREGE
ncbi:hypothetical protein [Paracoccus beibuensis]|uniref:hypothetical protein n=1 Tax=Paracoccus beibuensis TaxID=547602 RepID=UPI00223F19E2|nr:hypothetical protein [Paracoccus beibuensis]